MIARARSRSAGVAADQSKYVVESLSSVRMTVSGHTVSSGWNGRSVFVMAV